MDTVWNRSRAGRPNPYLDWELRTRKLRVGAPEDWCSVQIQLVPADGSYVPNLVRLVKVVSEGRQDDDDADDLTIRMAADEYLFLTTLISDIEKKRIEEPSDPVDAQFFLYRPESLANRQTNAAANGFYDIMNVGPPIPGLTFNRIRGATDPTSFDRSLAALSGHVGIGIIDDGIAFAHERFRDSRGGSRIKAIWLQDVERPAADLGVAFGQRLNNAEINTYLRTCKTEAEIYRRVGLIDFGKTDRNALGSRASHGTHILDLAGGFDPSSQRDPVKDRRPLFAVQLPSAVTGDTSGVTMGSYVLQAVRQIMLWADMVSPRLPLVINFSYGIEAGPKNGTHQIERALSQLIDRRNRRGAPTCLVLPSGNSYRERTTARMELKSEASHSIDWIMLPDDGTPNHLEVWLDGEQVGPQVPSVEVTLTPPGGAPSAIRGLGDGDMETLEVSGEPIAGIYYSIIQNQGLADRARIHLSVNATASRWSGGRPAPAGRWRLTIANKSQSPLTARLYIQRDDTPMGYRQRGRQSHFDHAEAFDRIPGEGSYRGLSRRCPITSEDTLSAIATGAGSIVVGAADASGLATDYTASGPALLRNGPDCSAVADHGPAHWGVLAAGTYSGSVVAMRGTSVAAPQLVRRIADYLESQDSGPVLFAVATNRSTGALAAPPGTAALRSIVADSAAVVPASDPRRLGSFVLRERTTPAIPKRTY